MIEATLFGGTLGLMVSRNAAEPLVPVQSFAAFNAMRYGPAFSKVAVTKRPRLFPVVDRFIGGDNDALSWQSGISLLSKLGLNGVSVEPIDQRRESLLTAAGQTLTSGAVYAPPGRTSTAAALTAWAEQQAAPYIAAGVQPQGVVTFALSDEPGFYWPSIAPNMSVYVMAAAWLAYLKAQRLTPADFGQTSWAAVRPSSGRAAGGTASSPLTARKLYYWTMRFVSADLAAYFGRSTKALEAAFKSPRMSIFTNFNNFAGRLFVPGPIFHIALLVTKTLNIFSACP